MRRRASRHRRGRLSCSPSTASPAGINVTVTVAFAAFIWSNQVQAERRNDAAHADLSRRIDHLAESVGSRIEGLTAEVSGLGQRLARLEGWIERDRVGEQS